MSETILTGTRLQTILIVRNDGSTGWQDSAYCLQKGELGIEYLDNGNIIVRSGIDGKTSWDKCPQVEGVLEKDLRLTYDFGKYKTVNGFVDAGGKNMTVLQWIENALSDRKDPAIEQPTYTLSTSTVVTNSGTYEIGSKVTQIKWNGSTTAGSYEYGSVDADGKVYTKADGTGITKSYKIECTNAGSGGQTEDGTWTFNNPITIENASGTALGTITGTYSWTDSPRTPVDNLGNEVEGIIEEGSITKTANYSVTGYREGLFYGWFTSKKEADDITGEMIRLTLSGTEQAGGKGYKTSKTYASTINSRTGVDTPIVLNVQPGAATLFIAWPSAHTGATNILNTTVNANMNEAFDISNPAIVSIGGYNNEYETNYKMITYTPATPYEGAAELKITLG